MSDWRDDRDDDEVNLVTGGDGSHKDADMLEGSARNADYATCNVCGNQWDQSIRTDCPLCDLRERVNELDEQIPDSFGIGEYDAGP